MTARTYPIPHTPISKKKSVVFVDLETSGFKPWAGARITEFCAIRVSPDKTEYFHELSKPFLYSEKSLLKLSPIIVNLTHITDEMLDSCRCSFDVFVDFINFIGKDTCIAHNSAFEKSFIDYYCKALRIDLDVKFMDTLPMFKSVFGQGKLSLLTESSAAHSAFDDTYQMLKLFKKCQVLNKDHIKLCKETVLTEYANSAIQEDIVKISSSIRNKKRTILA
jgi:DNA polymerase III epsilon subunit-like protein